MTLFAKSIHLVVLTLAFLQPAIVFPQSTETQDQEALTSSSDVLATTQDQPQDFLKQIALLRESLTAATNLEDAARKQLEENIGSIESNVNRIAILKEESKNNSKVAAEAPEKAKELQQSLEQLNSKGEPSVDKNADLDSVEKLVRDTQTQVQQLQQQLANIELETSKRVARRKEIRTQWLSVSERRNNLRQQLDVLTKDSSLATDIVRLDIQVKAHVTDVEEEAQRAELDRYDAEESTGLFRFQRELLTSRLKRSQSLLGKLQTRQNELQALKAQQASEAAKEKQEKVREPLLDYSYSVNTQLADETVIIVSAIAKASKSYDAEKKKLDDIRDKKAETIKRVNEIGLTSSVGSMLRIEKNDLPDTQFSLLDTGELKQQVERVQFEYYDLDEQLKNLNFDQIVSEIQENYGPQSPSTIESIRGPIEELIASRRQLLADANSLKKDHYYKLIGLELVEKELKKSVDAYREFINERILWIRSNQLLFTNLEIDDGDLRLARVSNWSKAANWIVNDFKVAPLLYGLSAFLIVVLLWLKPKFRIEIGKQGEIAEQGRCTTLWPTSRTLVLSALVAITLPLIPLLLGIRIQFMNSGEASELIGPIGNACLATAWFFIPVEIFRRFCRLNGLAHKHFEWSDQAVNTLRNNLVWASLFGGTIVFIATLFYFVDTTHRVDLIERIVVVIGLIGLTVFLYRCFNPRSGVFSDYLRSNERTWANQTSTVWFGLILLLPASLIVMTVVGYYYTVINFVSCVYSTFVFTITIETARALLLRFILVRRRHAHIESAKRKRALQVAEAEKMAALEGAPLPPNADVVTESQVSIDIDENALQAGKLVSAGMFIVWAFALFIIWSDVLPALQQLDNYSVWPTVEYINKDEMSVQNPLAIPTEKNTPSTPTEATQAKPETTQADSASSTSDSGNTEPNVQTRITVRHLLIFLLVTISTLILANKLPSSVEMLFLDQLPVDRSIRHAIKALFSYSIILIGTVFAFQSLSIGWSQVQWLATALTFGLAFGLQEIFANFVAGLIILFERPMRIGDWITVDEHTGVVTKIRTRATTIVTLNRKEYIIPNKDFITGRVVNWTLSDALNRVDIKIGIAYGSNMERAKSILMKIAENHPLIVNDPAPSVVFQEFGDSALNITMRGFLPNVDCRPQVIDELNTTINQEFNEAGIEISFPQRDLHIRSIDESIVSGLRSERNTSK